MDNADFLPTDLAECQQMLMAAWQQSVQLEQQVAASEQQATAAAQKAAELNHVLDETAATHKELQQTHAATLEELDVASVNDLGRDGLLREGIRSLNIQC